MAVKTTILGSGTCVPRLDRSACALLVQVGQSSIVLDLGPGTLRRLLRTGTSIFDVSHIFLSHFHPDHTSDLVPLLFATKYPDDGPRPTQLQVLGGTGLNDFYQGLQAAYGHWIVLPGDQVRFQQIDAVRGAVLEFDEFRVIARPVNHRPESLAYRIEDARGRAVVYSGDTEPCETLVDLAHKADLLVCESAMPDEQRIPGHLTPSLAGDIAERARARQLVLTHLYPACDEVDIVKQASKAYKGKVVAAEDLMAFEIR